MLHVKVQDSPGLGVLLLPSEQLIIPLVGLVSDGQVTNIKHIKHLLLSIQILLHGSLVIYKIKNHLPLLHVASLPLQLPLF